MRNILVIVPTLNEKNNIIILLKKYKISQIPIQLPYSKLGSSKMQIKDMIFSLYYLMIVFVKKIFGQYYFQ